MWIKTEISIKTYNGMMISKTAILCTHLMAFKCLFITSRKFNAHKFIWNVPSRYLSSIDAPNICSQLNMNLNKSEPIFLQISIFSREPNKITVFSILLFRNSARYCPIVEMQVQSRQHCAMKIQLLTWAGISAGAEYIAKTQCNCKNDISGSPTGVFLILIGLSKRYRKKTLQSYSNFQRYCWLKWHSFFA